jgi:hypothetical protein
MFRSNAAKVTCLVGIALSVASCGKDPEVPTTPPPDAGVTAPVAPTVATAPTTAPTPAAPTTGPCDGAMQLALQLAIQQKAKQDLAPAMKPDGNLVCENVSEGGTVSAPFTFAPGKCYSVIAYSMGNVTEVDIRVKPDLGPNPPPPLGQLLGNFTGAQDSSTGPNAIIGPKNDCFKYPVFPLAFAMPFAAKAETTARAGSGPVAVQVFVK